MVLEGTSTRFSGSAAAGQTRAVVDGTGRLVELTVDALLLRRPARGIAEAILTAVQQAQDVGWTCAGRHEQRPVPASKD